MAALPLAAAVVSRDPVAVAAVAFAGQLPWLVTSLVAGAIADRYDRRRLMWVVDGLRALVMAGLAALIGLGALNVATLCVVAFLVGAGQTLFDNAGQALVPVLVHRNALASANGRLITTRITITGFIGPPLGGVLFTAAATLPFLVDAASFAVAAALIAVMPYGRTQPLAEPAPEPTRSSLRGDIREGVRWLVAHPVLRWVAILIAVVNFTQAATQSILVLFALQELSIGQLGFGILLAASGLGGLIGGLSGGILRRLIPIGPLFAVTVLVTVPIFIVLGVTSSPAVVAVMLALNAFAGITASVLLQTLRQAIVPNRLMARVSSAMAMLGVGIGLPLGSVAGGLLAQTLGLRAPFLVSAALIALTALTVPRLTRAFVDLSRQE